MDATGRAHCVYLYTSLTASVVWVLSEFVDEGSVKRLFTVSLVLRSLLAVWALWWHHNKFLQCVAVLRVPKCTGIHIHGSVWENWNSVIIQVAVPNDKSQAYLRGGHMLQLEASHKQPIKVGSCACVELKVATYDGGR